MIGKDAPQNYKPRKPKGKPVIVEGKAYYPEDNEQLNQFWQERRSGVKEVPEKDNPLKDINDSPYY